MTGRIVTFGEIMLRLKSPGYERLLQRPVLEAAFGGAEANVAFSLANYGMDAAFVTVLPDNDLGRECARELRGSGVDVSGIVYKPGRMGVYYLEAGAGQRPGRVIYDRAGSALAEAGRGDIDWDCVLQGAAWFHFTGITPAVSQRAAELTEDAVKAAAGKGLQVSCDLNIRRNLWQYGKTPAQVMPSLVKHVNTLIGGEEDLRLLLAQDQDPGSCEILFRKLMDRYPALKRVVITRREGTNADCNAWSACLYNGRETIASRRYAITGIVDRVGAGDSFCAGLIRGLMVYGSEETALEFGAAACCLKHTIPGDWNRVSVEEVEALMNGADGSRVRR